MVELTRDDVRFALKIAASRPHSDPATCESDALFALLKASRTYRPGVGTFRGYAAQRIVWAVQNGQRGQRGTDYLSRTTRARVKAGEIEDPGPPPSLDAVHGPTCRLIAGPLPDVDEETRISVQDALAALDTRAGLVVRLRYHDWTGEETAEFLGVTVSRVSQLYRAGLLELREALGITSSAELLAA